VASNKYKRGVVRREFRQSPSPIPVQNRANFTSYSDDSVDRALIVPIATGQTYGSYSDAVKPLLG